MITDLRGKEKQPDLKINNPILNSITILWEELEYSEKYVEVFSF